MPKKWLSVQAHCNPREIGPSIFRSCSTKTLPPSSAHATAPLLQQPCACLERRTDRQSLEKDEKGKYFVTCLFRSSAGWLRHGFSAPCAEAPVKFTADFWRSMENHFLGVPPRRVGAAGALTRSRASTTRTRRPQSVAGPRQMALVDFQVHRGTGCSSSRWL